MNEIFSFPCLYVSYMRDQTGVFVSLCENSTNLFEFQCCYKHLVSDRITDDLIAVYGLLDSCLKLESDSIKRRLSCAVSACVGAVCTHVCFSTCTSSSCQNE